MVSSHDMVNNNLAVVHSITPIILLKGMGRRTSIRVAVKLEGIVEVTVTKISFP